MSYNLSGSFLLFLLYGRVRVLLVLLRLLALLVKSSVVRPVLLLSKGFVGR